MILLADRQIFSSPSKTTVTKETDVEGNGTIVIFIVREVNPFV